MMPEKFSPIHVAVFLFPVLIATVSSGGGVLYAPLLVFGLLLAWSEWGSLETWEKRTLIGFVAFFILVSLSLVHTHDYANGVKKVGRYIHFPLIIPMYLLFKKYQVETGKMFLLGLSAASVVMFLQGFYQTSILGWPRAVGAINSLVFGDISILIAVIVGCALFTISTNWRHYLLGVLVICLALSAGVMSGSRGSWIVLPVVLAWFLWLKRKKLKFIPLVLMTILGSLLVWGALSLDQINKRVEIVKVEYQMHSQNPETYTAIGSRLEMWNDSITIWKAHPLIGTGIGDFKNDRYQLFKDGVSHMEKRHNHAHNIYFDVLATAGLVGLLGMLIFMQILPFKIFYSFWIKEHDHWLKFYALSGMTAIIAFAVFGLTEGWLARNAFVRTYLICILVFMSSIAVIKVKEVKS